MEPKLNISNGSNQSLLNQKDSIFVSKLPTQVLLPDLKQILIRHFTNFGNVRRISCSSKSNKERVAHLQFSCPKEAFEAQKNGSALSSHTLVINLTDKRPTTQILSTRPLPLPLSFKLTPPMDNLHIEPRVQQRSTLKSYFNVSSTPTSSSPAFGNNGNSRVEMPKIAGSSTVVPHPSLDAATCSYLNENFTATITNCVEKEQLSSLNKVIAPNACRKIELYQGQGPAPPNVNVQSQVQYSLSGPSLSQQLHSTKSVQNLQSSIRNLYPVRSLSEILNLDISKMKVVKTVNASDALACQFFSGRKHPFPLALMFGRNPGSVIMPVNSIMDKIRPGLEIEESTLDATWNSVLNAVTKNLVKLCAEKIFVQEKTLTKMSLAVYENLEEVAVADLLMLISEHEVNYEEEVLTCCEDKLDDLIGDVCGTLILNVVLQQQRLHQKVFNAAVVFYKNMENEVINTCTTNQARSLFLEELCEEVIEDLLECTYFDRCVKVAVKDAYVGLVSECSRVGNVGIVLPFSPPYQETRTQGCEDRDLLMAKRGCGRHSKSCATTNAVSDSCYPEKTVVVGNLKAPIREREMATTPESQINVVPKERSGGLFMSLKRRAFELADVCNIFKRRKVIASNDDE